MPDLDLMEIANVLKVLEGAAGIKVKGTFHLRMGVHELGQQPAAQKHISWVAPKRRSA